MNEDHQQLESLLRAIHTYQVDVSTDGILGSPDEEYLDESGFLGSLYVSRDEGLEERIVQQVSLRQNVVCIFGERGCGKTSMLRSLRAKLVHKRKKVILVDIKVLWEQIASLAPEPIDSSDTARLESLFGRIIRDALLRELWPSQAQRDRMHAWLLAGPEGSDLPRFTTLEDVINDVRHIARALSGVTHADRMSAILNAIETTPNQFGAVIKQLRRIVSAAQLARCYARLNPGNELVVIYDNVDRIPVVAPQSTFLRIVNDFQLAASPLASAVVGIRPENLRAAGARPNRAGDIWNIVFLESTWPGFSLLPAETLHLQSILSKRHDYFAAVAARQRRLENEPYLTSTGRLHKQVMAEIARESLLLLVNGNLRVANSLYADFLPFLLGLDLRFPGRFEKAVESGDAENHLQTLMYYWIRERGPANDFPIHDFERDALASSRSGKVASMASLEHLVMATVLNFHSDPEKMPQDGWWGWPTIKAVKGRLRLLGFHALHIESAIERLRGEPGEPNEVLAVEGLGENRRVRLTPSGRHLLLEVYNKVGFIWPPALRWHNRDGSKRTLDYFGLNTQDRILVLAEYLEMRAKRHLRMLNSVRRNMRTQGRKWLSTYRNYFGVGGSLQVERLLRSASAFYGWSFTRESPDLFVSILSQYENCLQPLEVAEVTKRVDIEALWRSFERRERGTLRRD